MREEEALARQWIAETMPGEPVREQIEMWRPFGMRSDPEPIARWLVAGSGSNIVGVRLPL